ncbi:hypothetical protein MJG53_005024 [Ovis ammon polii x Ovis aries]|uniref:Uncharacterized protein n=1 Tax=Ovis ammon polii x Ovis aries TaxID=2918886 RepID=A0ACB9VBF0_9CETA|nr:hypothetical protein MJT46_003055 [Ovis ammon polii x Ovis aries]KAI4587237.1 hypothetical protein MJG53_005024 [Ovis ammon polii x Ovis aries]
MEVYSEETLDFQKLCSCSHLHTDCIHFHNSEQGPYLDDLLSRVEFTELQEVENEFLSIYKITPETYQFGLLQELKTGYKDETDFTTGLELHIRKTNKQEGPRRSSSKNRCTVTGRDIKEMNTVAFAIWHYRSPPTKWIAGNSVCISDNVFVRKRTASFTEASLHFSSLVITYYEYLGFNTHNRIPPDVIGKKWGPEEVISAEAVEALFSSCATRKNRNPARRRTWVLIPNHLRWTPVTSTAQRREQAEDSVQPGQPPSLPTPLTSPAASDNGQSREEGAAAQSMPL